MIHIEVIDAEVQAMFVRLRASLTNLRPLMQDIGEHLTETTKQRFQTSTAPDGSPWAPNAQSTYVQLAGKFAGKGRINKRGAARMAYAAGRWERIQAARETHPFLRYMTRADERVRESHRQWHNVTLPVDDPWWKTHYPPCGWACRCRAVALRAKDVENRPGLIRQAPDEPDVQWTNPLTGEVKDVPFAVDPGFAYNVGDAHMRWQGLIDAARQKIEAYQADLGVAVRDDLRELVHRDWAQWTQAVSEGAERNRLG